MRALVTGGTGFVGCHVVRALRAEGLQVRVLARRTSRLDNVAGADAVDVEIVYGDLNDPPSLKQALCGCDRLYHVAADYRLWSPRPEELYRSNVDGTRAVLSAAAESGLERVVYTSTVGALGFTSDRTPASESTPVSEADMIGHYKRSKYRAERVADEFAAKGLPVVIVNPSTPVGERDIKPTPTGQIIVDFLNGRMPAYVNTGLNLVDVRDVAAGIWLAGEHGTPGERYILGNTNMTLKDVLTTVADIAGKPAPRLRIPYPLALAAIAAENVLARAVRRPPAHPLEAVRMAKRYMYYDSSKAVRQLGLPQSPIRGALERAVQWFDSNGYVTARNRRMPHGA